MTTAATRRRRGPAAGQPAAVPPAAREGWAADPLGSSGSPRLLETLLGAGLILENLATPGLSIPAAELCAILLIVLASFRPPRRDLSRYGLLAVLAAALLAFLVVETFVNGLDPTRRAVRIGILMLLIYAIASERIDVKGLLYGMAAAGLVNVPLFYAGLVSREYGDYLTGLLGDKNVSGLFYALIVPLLLTVAQRWWVKLGVIGVGLALTFLTGSRTSLAALVCAVLWVFLSPYLGRVFRLVLLGGMAWLVSWAEENLADLAVFGDRTGTDWFRAQIQEAAAAKTAAAPWYGEGLSTATVDLEQGTFFYHNSYLGLLTEGGWVFFAVVVGAYVFLGLRPFAPTRRSSTRIALEAATVIILVTSLQLGEVFITLYGAIILGMGLLLTVHESEQAAAARATATGLTARSERIVARSRRGAARASR
ncbi:O-antigen ligase family protein [Micrococcus luteus]|uniref:O-antigen ligase family protein n=1 Tax=Micrococcus luteus TaxID=1270 RepID=UPI000FD64AAC|nr:hypothetical protein [Micrococcus luteus]